MYYSGVILLTMFSSSFLFFLGGGGSIEDYKEFVKDLNTNIWNIHLTITFSLSTVEFLDLKIGLQNGKINTTLFHKIRTATNSLLYYTSFHLRHLLDGIPVGQFARVRRNCSSESEFHLQAQKLTKRFSSRGYPRNVVSQAFQRTKTT